MKRKSSRRRRAAAAFFSDNRRLFPFVGLYLLGVVIGTAVYVTADEGTAGLLRALVTPSAVTGGLRGILHALCGSCFSLLALLCAQFLLGLWPCGAPFVLLLPMLQGTATGLGEAALYAEGGRGVAAAALTVLPSALLSGRRCWPWRGRRACASAPCCAARCSRRCPQKRATRRTAHRAVHCVNRFGCTACATRCSPLERSVWGWSTCCCAWRCPLP